MLASRFSLAVFLLTWLLHAFTVTRSIRFDPKKPSQCRVRIDFTDTGGGFPRVFLLVETLASDAVVREALWNGKAFPPNRELTPEKTPRPTGHWRWLFGYGEGNPPCEAGRLEYTLVFPASYSVKSRATIEGKVLTSDNERFFVEGETELYDVKGIKAVVGHEGTLALTQGWNLVAVPCPLDEATLATASVTAWFGLDAAAGAYLQLDSTKVGTDGQQAVWAYRTAGGTFTLPLSWGMANGEQNDRRPMPQGWVLSTASESVVEGRRERWHWQGSHYRPCAQEAAFWERLTEGE